MNIKDYLDQNNLRWKISLCDFSAEGYDDHINSLNTRAKKTRARMEANTDPTPAQKEFLKKFKSRGVVV